MINVLVKKRPQEFYAFYKRNWSNIRHVNGLNVIISDAAAKFTNDIITYNLNSLRPSRMTLICVEKRTIIGSDNGLSPGRRQAIIWTNAGIFLFGPLGSNFSEILIEIDTF